MTEKIFDIAAYKKVGMIQQKQKEFFALRLHAIAGDFTAVQMKKIAEVAEKFGKGQIHCSTRQGIEIHFVHHTNLEIAKGELESVGVAMGACGPRVRIVTGCPGSATCRWGIIDTKEVAAELDKTWFREETPHKFKMAVTGCPHNCAKATENDIGVMGGIIPAWEAASCSDCGLCVNICPTNAIRKDGDEYVVDLPKCINCSICTASCPAEAWKIASSGYILWIGGTMGKIPRLATRLGDLVESEERLYDLVKNTVEYYRNVGRKKERFGHTIDRIGVDSVREAILNGQ
jgi:dissimilatory sulfite reductase (desulfoviridin) alpha/beta subunit